MYRANIKF